MITVANVLALPDLGLETVVEADTGVPVSWVVTSELADPTPYLHGGEILLLTGVNSAVRGSSWWDYVRRLAGRGVVALGMGAGDHLSYPRMPRELVQACEDAALTLFSVPERIPFLGIIRAAADMPGRPGARGRGGGAVHAAHPREGGRGSRWPGARRTLPGLVARGQLGGRVHSRRGARAGVGSDSSTAL